MTPITIWYFDGDRLCKEAITLREFAQRYVAPMYLGGPWVPWW